MFVLCFFLIFVGILYLNSQNHFDAQELLENATYIVFFLLLLLGFLCFWEMSQVAQTYII